MRKALAPIAFVALFAVVIGLLNVLRGDPDPRPVDEAAEPVDETDLPDFVPAGQRAEVAELRRGIRDALGRDAAAFRALREKTPEDGSHRVEWLRFFRPEVDLAVRSADGAAGSAALGFVRAALGAAGSPARELVNGPAYRDTWIRALKSGTPELRVAALRLAGVLDGEPNRARAAAALDDPAAGVRIAAIDVYILLGGSAPRLASRYDGETDERVRLSILMAFGTAPAPRGPEVLGIEARAIGGTPDSLRIQTMRNLAKFRDQDLLDAVIANLDSPSIPVRKCALETMARLRDRRALERLRRHAEKEEDEALAGLTRKVIAGLE
ncbi:MAG: HEAT repeat domain-containing protein [Planctomycetota bacterium]